LARSAAGHATALDRPRHAWDHGLAVPHRRPRQQGNTHVRIQASDLGEGVHEGQVVNVLVSEGDDIAEYQPMMEVETDKAAVEIPSPKSGVVKKIHVEAGQTVKVGEVMLTIDDGGGGGGDAAPAKKEKPAEKPT
jgi:pyruvate/2-oxoglutarate dehydrogenase complex dihydrolipoamide acyltransferase (E2) component